MSHVLDNTMGAAYIATVVGAMAYGITCSQTLFYYTRYYKKDRWYLQVLVAGTWLCDTVHQALVSHSVYTYLVTYYGVPSELIRIVPTIMVEIIFTALTALMVQMFFVYRIWKMSKKNVALTAVILALVVGDFATILTYFIRSAYIHDFITLQELKGLSISVNVLTVACDVMIAGTLCTLLYRSKTGFNRSDTMIDKLMVYSVNTGLLTSLCAICSLITITALPTTFVYIAFFFLMGRLYCNSLLATLNARKGLLRQGFPLALQVLDDSNNSAQHARLPGVNGIAVKVETAVNASFAVNTVANMKRAETRDSSECEADRSV